MHRQRDGICAHAARPRELALPRRRGRGSDGRSVSRGGRRAARGVGPEAALQGDSRRARPPGRNDRRDRDA